MESKGLDLWPRNSDRSRRWHCCASSSCGYVGAFRQAAAAPSSHCAEAEDQLTTRPFGSDETFATTSGRSDICTGQDLRISCIIALSSRFGAHAGRKQTLPWDCSHAVPETPAWARDWHLRQAGIPTGSAAHPSFAPIGLDSAKRQRYCRVVFGRSLVNTYMRGLRT